MSEKERKWDVVNYLHSPKDAFLYLEAASEEDAGDGIEIRIAWAHVELAHREGKITIDLEMTSEEFCRTLREHGIYESEIPKIVGALGMRVRIAD